MVSLFVLLAAPASTDDLQVSIELAPGESVAVGDQGLVVGFDGVPEYNGHPMDSRCPLSVTCVWGGDAWVDVWAEMPGQERVEITLHTHPMEGPQQFEIEGYLIMLMLLEPYPVVAGDIPGEDYRAQLDVSGAPRVESGAWSPGMLKARYSSDSR